jgi:hypothetical protein
MRSFTVQLIFSIICDEAMTDVEQYEEQWRVVMAPSEDEAIEAARVLGKEEEASFSDRHGRTVKWQLLAIKDIREVLLDHGALLFSTIKEAAPVAAPLWTKPGFAC